MNTYLLIFVVLSLVLVACTNEIPLVVENTTNMPPTTSLPENTTTPSVPNTTAPNMSTQTTNVSADSKMSFFITSIGPGNGANLGGLSGADAYCETLASTVGAGDKTWHAYLSTTGVGGVNARDRIGIGPWYNAKGVMIATDISQLHGNNSLTKETQLNEKGEIVNGRGDTPNRHDILTGSLSNGTASSALNDTTCGNWMSSTNGSALVGHHDRIGGGADPTSWNSAHASRGCSQQDLIGTGGDGLFYCFAID